MSARKYSIVVTNPEGKTFETSFVSATTVTNAVLARPELEAWYFKTTVQGFAALLQRYGDKLPTDIPSLHSLLSQEGLSPYAQRDDASAIGIKIHNALARKAKGRVVKDYDEVNAWWAKEITDRKAQVLLAEQPVVSFVHKYAGTVDLVRMTLTGTRRLSDYKSGKPRQSHVLQLGAYMEAWNEMNPMEPIDELSIIETPRDGGPLVEFVLPDPNEAARKWYAALELYRTLPKKFNPEKGDW